MRKRPTQDLLIQSQILSRRTVIAGLPLLVAGCVSSGGYGVTQDGGFGLTPIDLTTIDPSLLRQEVAWRGKERPGSIVVNVPERRLYLVEDGGRALRYGVGVGRTDNPLGARALYLYRDGHDTFFRLHGTTEPETIGQAVSSGCIRLFNQDIIDLYNRVPVGTHVTVVQG